MEKRKIVQPELGQPFHFQPSMVLMTRAFRGYWLVQSLLKNNWRVTVVNWPMTTGQTLHEIDGPFPLLVGPQISPEMVEAYQSICITAAKQELEQSETYFQILLEDGPLNFHGQLGVHQLQKRNISSAVIDELGGLKPAKPTISRSAYQNVWPHLLARQVAALEEFPQVRAFGRGRPLSIGQKMVLREMEPESEAQVWENLKSAGGNFEYHTLLPNDSDLTVETGRGRINGIKFGGQEFQVDGLVWALSAEESMVACSAKSSWSSNFESAYVAWQKAGTVWMSMAAEIQADSDVLDGLPLWFSVTADIDLPWKNENFIVVRKNLHKAGWSVWIRVPSDVMASTERQEEIWNRCQKLLEARIPEAQVKRMTAVKVRFGARVEKEGGRGRDIIGKNYILIGPDRWANWSGEDAMIWEGKALEQMEIFNKEWEAEALRLYRQRQKELQREERARQRAEERSRNG